jgi:hypothetical protein
MYDNDEPMLGDFISERLATLSCVAMQVHLIVDPAAHDLMLQAIANAVDSFAPKRDEKQGFNRLRSIQGGTGE